jgi:lipoprotein-releasing system permease protein
MTISIMGGFGNDLKRKILGNNAHVIVDRERGGFTDWRPLLAQHPRAARGDQPRRPRAGRGDGHLADQPLGGHPPGIDPARAGRRTGTSGATSSAAASSTSPTARLSTLPPTTAARQRRGELELPTTRLDGRRALNRATGPLRPPPPGAAAEAAAPGIIVGRELAANLHLAVGDEVRVVSPFGSIGPLGPMPKTKLFRVAGIFYSGMYEYDTKYAYVLIPVAQRFFNYRATPSPASRCACATSTAPTTSAAMRSPMARARGCACATGRSSTRTSSARSSWRS